MTHVLAIMCSLRRLATNTVTDKKLNLCGCLLQLCPWTVKESEMAVWAGALMHKQNWQAAEVQQTACFMFQIWHFTAYLMRMYLMRMYNVPFLLYDAWACSHVLSGNVYVLYSGLWVSKHFCVVSFGTLLIYVCLKSMSKSSVVHCISLAAQQLL